MNPSAASRIESGIEPMATEPAAAELARYGRPLDRALLAAELPGFDVETVRETGSTNADLLAAARLRQPARPRLRAALAQSAGRGRLGRRWYGAPGAGLLFSLALPLPPGAAAPVAAPLACGIALAETLLADGVRVALKWPNDVLLAGRKLAGVLCELAQDAVGAGTLVIGVGLNLWADAATRASAGQALACLSERIGHGQLIPSRERLIARFARALEEYVGAYLRAGFVPLQPGYMRWFAHADQTVRMMEQGLCVAEGRALGVDGAGRLLLHTANGLRSFISGEVSLRASSASS
jgi:BirA family biotin operon repressor/biotin-[acetyl-CoA-carboxylase] ligase